MLSLAKLIVCLLAAFSHHESENSCATPDMQMLDNANAAVHQLVKQEAALMVKNMKEMTPIEQRDVYLATAKALGPQSRAARAVRDAYARAALPGDVHGSFVSKYICALTYCKTGIFDQEDCGAMLESDIQCSFLQSEDQTADRRMLSTDDYHHGTDDYHHGTDDYHHGTDDYHQGYDDGQSGYPSGYMPQNLTIGFMSAGCWMSDESVQASVGMIGLTLLLTMLAFLRAENLGRFEIPPGYMTYCARCGAFGSRQCASCCLALCTCIGNRFRCGTCGASHQAEDDDCVRHDRDVDDLNSQDGDEKLSEDATTGAKQMSMDREQSK